MTNLIISITFSFYSPLIIPIYLMGVILIKYLHKVMQLRYDMTLQLSHDDDLYYLPVHLLVFGVIFLQITVLLFLSFCVYSLFPATMFVIACAIMDYAVIKNMRLYIAGEWRQTSSLQRRELPPIHAYRQTVPTQQVNAKKMLNISRKKLSYIDEDAEQFDDEAHVQIVVGADQDDSDAPEPDDELDMKSYEQWTQDMREKMKSATSNSSAQSVLSSVTPVPLTESMMHQTQISASDSQHYAIELSKNPPQSKIDQEKQQDT
eukprot:372419_1